VTPHRVDILLPEPLWCKVASLVVVKFSKIQVIVFLVITFEVSRLITDQVNQEDLVIRSHKDIAGLDVSMDHRLIVNLAHPAESLEDQPRLLTLCHFGYSVPQLFLQTLVNKLSVREVNPLPLLLEPVKVEDQNVGMFG